MDGGKDNNPSGVPTIAQQLNDVILTSAGNVGIGTVDPSVKLEINNGTVSRFGNFLNRSIYDSNDVETVIKLPKLVDRQMYL